MSLKPSGGFETPGPEHHMLVGASLLTAYKNAGGELELSSALAEMQARASKGEGRGADPSSSLSQKTKFAGRRLS